ncbi:hypothetical protein PUN28_011154 [Cardiocondyla obscurior]|uniref:Uncharacterized protein n=1 Tax=Cardiocondyla obscurior TaxID=286306 RepID=A0AAW2FPP7_9HYME
MKIIHYKYVIFFVCLRIGKQYFALQEQNVLRKIFTHMFINLLILMVRSVAFANILCRFARIKVYCSHASRFTKEINQICSLSMSLFVFLFIFFSSCKKNIFEYINIFKGLLHTFLIYIITLERVMKYTLLNC